MDRNMKRKGTSMIGMVAPQNQGGAVYCDQAKQELAEPYLIHMPSGRKFEAQMRRISITTGAMQKSCPS